MENYELLREDWDSILELAQFTGRPEVASQIPSKVSPGSTADENPSQKSFKGSNKDQSPKIHLMKAAAAVVYSGTLLNGHPICLSTKQPLNSKTPHYSV